MKDIEVLKKGIDSVVKDLESRGAKCMVNIQAIADEDIIDWILVSIIVKVPPSKR